MVSSVENVGKFLQISGGSASRTGLAAPVDPLSCHFGEANFSDRPRFDPYRGERSDCGL
ncbi:hypothetical protein LEP1GSC125_0948 [Leptospira mayottensis 200901122]|uniref:Uncharacterized protein n=1 Tax=Leptospira mayottensis 200901122 TaxID=1193010 RepID=A0AA87SYM6_9LEPT|nr:hypothetical protein LEP1GSC125_0948 [Leptospira mayottensis 200901122]